jgi:hypothetical protein
LNRQRGLYLILNGTVRLLICGKGAGILERKEPRFLKVTGGWY